MLRVLIVDDEPRARLGLRRLLADHPNVEVVGEAEAIADTLELIASRRPDLVFLDIALNGSNGFDVISNFDRPPKIVFITAHPEHALDAFSVAAVDYILKPVDEERLAETIVRVEKALLSERAFHPPIELRTPSRSVLVAPQEIVALKADGDFTQVLLADQGALMMLRTLKHFESQLPSPPFLRLGRSLMINRDRLRRIDVRSRDDIWLTMDGISSPLTIGRMAALRLRAVLRSRPI
ncbi:LytTR family DNA-binding domain-containing protein [Xanthobacter sp. DSM 24535]|uniref:LytTR family two component transcriptional regulator n=1 Tax=Aquabacter spiritensis TaxID=933073 RepID=A0A4R3LNX4_9HYPH|nr:LytTR family DNA-binding domain-containing protein [Aquabacter spiritensis]TCT01861.1 LytTR family two component transcriptional regulator [Aquabacter spiritensis]